MSDGNGRGIDCLRCGRFRITDEAIADIPGYFSKDRLPLLVASHHLSNNDSREFVVTLDWLRLIAQRNQLPKAKEQLANLIRFTGAQLHTPVATISMPLSRISAIAGTADNDAGIYWLLQHAATKGLMTFTPERRDVSGQVTNFVTLGLTFEGWSMFDDLHRATRSTSVAFMAMQFGDPELMAMYEKCFRPAAADVGLDLKLVTEGQPAGLIDHQIRAAIRDSRLVIADLTHDNRGAYWEAGFGEGLGLPVIYTCEQEKFERDKTHFDTNHMVTVIWKKGDIGGPRRMLVATIRATMPELILP